MRFKISEIGDEGLALDVPVTAAWLASECPDLDARPGRGGLRFKGRLQLMDDQVFLRGDLRGGLETPCARCLEPAAVPLALPMAVMFVERAPGDDVDGGDEDDEGEGGDGEPDVARFDGDTIDIGPEVRDQILLAMPVSSLCSESCLGLCPVCGGNRNQSPCDCASRVREVNLSPLAASLAKLKV